MSVPVRFGVTAPPRRPVAGLTLHQRLGPGVRPIAVEIDVPGVDAGGRVERTVGLVFGRRGEHRIGPLEVSSRFPLGFFRAAATVRLETRVLVRPREGRATSRLRRWLAGAQTSHRRPSLLARGDDSFHGIREFRDGDDPRRIHWRTTARTGVTTVTEWRRDAGRDVTLLLGRSQGAGVGASQHFETAVSVAATLWRAVLGLGGRPELEVGGRRRVGRQKTLGAGLDLLARVRPQGGRRPRAALRRLGRRGGSRVVVYVALGPEPGIRRRLAEAAGKGGQWLLLRADEPSVGRWVGGLG